MAQGDDAAAVRLVKAAYLFHFCSLVEWPAGTFVAADSPVRVGIVSDDALADDLQKLIRSRPVQGRRIVVDRISRPPQASAVHLLFVGDAQRDRLPEWLSGLVNKPVLTVTESEHALAFGSIVNFMLVQGTLRFEISQEAAAQAGLTISSRLLAVSYRFSVGSPKFRH